MNDSERAPERHRLRHKVGSELTGRNIPDNGVEGERALKAEQVMNVPLLIAAALTLPSVALTEMNVHGTVALIGQILNWGTWMAFAVEFVVMLIVVPDRKKYLLHHPVELIVVFLTPPVLPPQLQSIRAIRLLRLLRLLKLAQFSNRVFSNQGLAWAAFMTMLTALAGGTLFRAFEAPSQRITEWESVYWAFTAMTTVGSKFEATTVGSQIIEVVILIVGVSFMAMLTGSIAQRFVTFSGRDDGDDLER